jgi:hypothetical protein
MHTMIPRGIDILVRLSASKITSQDHIKLVELVTDEEVGRGVGEIVDIYGLEPVLDVLLVVAHKFPKIRKKIPCIVQCKRNHRFCVHRNSSNTILCCRDWLWFSTFRNTSKYLEMIDGQAIGRVMSLPWSPAHR